MASVSHTILRLSFGSKKAPLGSKHHWYPHSLLNQEDIGYRELGLGERNEERPRRLAHAQSTTSQIQRSRRYR